MQRIFFWAVLSLALGFSTGCGDLSRVPKTYEELHQTPQIYPDYSGTTVPPNIAPLNFIIEEEATQFITVVSGDSGDSFTLTGKTVDIPLSRWRNLLRENHGKEIRFEVYAKRDSTWKKYRPITNHVATVPIDPWVSYRLIVPGYEHYSFVGLYQRNLEHFHEEAFFKANLVDEKTCANCHNYQSHSTDSFLFHTRNVLGGTIFVRNGEAIKINTRLPETSGACVYPSWHPQLPLVAFSVNNTSQIFHSVSANKIEVFDSYSDLVLYDVDHHTITPIFPPSDETFETFPFWSPEGTTLYYSLAKLDLGMSRNLLPERKAEIFHRFAEFKYDLMKVSFDPETRSFGQPEMVFHASEMGKSALFPRVCPDGKTLIFTLSQYGTFPIWHPESDLWSLDLETGHARPLDEVNSDESESYHCWDSSGSWFVFSSRRDDGSYTRLYFTHKKEDGTFSKPFLLPQKDPLQNLRLMKSYNVPEMTKKPIELSVAELARAAREPNPRDATILLEKHRVRAIPAENE